jgi:hypothetical protein
MAENEASIPGLIHSLLDDIRELIREQIAIAREEIHDEVGTVTRSATAFGAAALAGLVGIVLLAVAIGGAIAFLLGWPAWSGYGIVALILLGGAYLLYLSGRRKLSDIRRLPKTTETMKENLAWLQSKSSQR